MFQIKWLRKLVRKYTNPIPERRASTVKKKLSLLYMLFAWNAFGVVCYMFYTGRGDWAKAEGYKTEEDMAIPPALQWARTLKFEKVKVIRMSGLHKEYEYDYDATEEKKVLDSESETGED